MQRIIFRKRIRQILNKKQKEAKGKTSINIGKKLEKNKLTTQKRIKQYYRSTNKTTI